MVKQLFRISGMTCGACAFSIQKHFKHVKGVRDVMVNFFKKEVVLEYDERKLNQAKIIQSLAPFGYTLQKS
jgi:copper chaperone CopZ